MIYAVFVAESWIDQVVLRMWVKKLDPEDAVLLTDDSTDGNITLSRQIRCEGLLCSVVRRPGAWRSMPDMDKARDRRDTFMMSLAQRIVYFGHLPGEPNVFTGRDYQHYPNG